MIDLTEKMKRRIAELYDSWISFEPEKMLKGKTWQYAKIIGVKPKKS